MKLIHFLLHQSRVESTFKEVFVSIERLEVAFDSPQHKREYFQLYSTHGLVWSICEQRLLICMRQVLQVWGLEFLLNWISLVV